ncbi:MAG: hypothetical protein OXH20_02540, partial [bacterium]|nr:hypothetical protein [bacterium]
MALPSTEIIFEVSENEIDGGYSASALGYGIHTEGEDDRRGSRQRQGSRRVGELHRWLRLIGHDGRSIA